jgi:uncharacterized protein with NRDE domain
MCTLIVLSRPSHPWPILIAANRDEMLTRPWRPPGRHWPDRPEVLAGLDELAGGSWLGINRHGLVAGILNRHGSLGPAQGMRSRGELVLEGLDHADADAAADALLHLDPHAYRSFNMVVADNTAAFWLRNLGVERGAVRIEAFPIPPGFSMITAYDRNDDASARIRDFLPRFEASPVPDPERGDWSAWQKLLGDRGSAAKSLPGAPDGEADNRESGMNVVTGFGFGTSSSSLLALPAVERVTTRPIWLFAAGRPDEAPYLPVDLAAALGAK